MSENSVVKAVRVLVEPIVADLGVDLYDLEYAGGQLIVTLDTPPGSEGGIALDVLALATRLISRELDHSDPIPGRYTLEVTSPGLERHLRTPAHFKREIGKAVALRLRNTGTKDRRVNGVLIAADDEGATIRLDDTDRKAGKAVPAEDALTERVVPYDLIDRARTVFVWGPAPKPGKAPKKGVKATGSGSRPKAADATTTNTTDTTDTEAPAS